MPLPRGRKLNPAAPRPSTAANAQSDNSSLLAFNNLQCFVKPRVVLREQCANDRFCQQSSLAVHKVSSGIGERREKAFDLCCLLQVQIVDALLFQD